MGSFRNRLLALIIGLIVVTQSVTLIAVLARTARDVQTRAAAQLRTGSSVAQQLIRFRAGQLANTVAVLAADFGFREAVASGDAATILSAAHNHAMRIGADVVLVLNTDGRVLVSSAPAIAAHDSQLREMLVDAAERDQARFALLGPKLYQLFVAPVRAPEPIGWVVMGFAVDDGLARRLHDLIGVEVSLIAQTHGGSPAIIASTLTSAVRSDLAARGSAGLDLESAPAVERVAGADYLSYAHPLEGSDGAVDLLLQEPMARVLAPYYDVRNAMFLIGGVALALAAGLAALLGRSAARPIGELVQAARRIQSGAYHTSVQLRGGKEFTSLASTFNAMQQGIAEREARILHGAYHDPLTGLPNRAGVQRHVDELLGESPPRRFALIVVELRNVREINASLGHHVGDEALREAARRLRLHAGTDDFVSRLAANQFLLIAPDCAAERATLIAEQLTVVVRTAYHLPAVSLELRAIAGVCCHPDHGASAGELLRRVQIALEDANEARGHAAPYRPGRDEQHQRRLTLAAGLRQAIESDALSLVYQPKVAIDSRSVRSLEALVRWTHPQLGEISPGEFVPIAERTGGVRRLSSWVLNAALRQMAQWSREELPIDVAVNLSAPDILDPELREEILRGLETHGVEPTRLVLEITESAVMRDAPLAARNMQLLRAAGVRFAIDDFGTGYSSLSQLSRLPVDELKIDRSFIMRAHERRGDAAIVMAIIELAHSMGLKVVAEGVENAECWNLLRRLSCDFAQGYLISRPLPSAEVAAFVRQANQLLASSDSTVRQMRALEELTSRGKP